MIKTERNQPEELKPEVFLVELPFKVQNIDPAGQKILELKSQIAKNSKVLNIPPSDVNPFLDVKLLRRNTPKLVYKKKTYRNSKGESKVVYEMVETQKSFQFKPEYFADFSYKSKVREGGFLKIFEDGFLGKRYLQSEIDEKSETMTQDQVEKKQKLQNQLNYFTENFCELFPPSQFTKEFAWVNNTINIEKEHDRENGNLKGKRNNKGNLISSSSRNGNLNQISIESDEYPVPGLKRLKANFEKIEGNPLIFYLEVSYSYQYFSKFIQTLFQQQPLWTIHNLQENLKSSPDRNIRQVSQFALKKALSQLTFLFKNGPFKFAYSYFKYDPRLDYKSIKYQTFNIGVKNINFMNDRNRNRRKFYKVLTIEQQSEMRQTTN